MNTLPEPDETWKPAYYTPSKSDKSIGELIADFAYLFLKAERGRKKGQPLQLTKWQIWTINRIFEINPETGLLRHKTFLLGLPRKNGKSMLGSLIVLYFLVCGEEGGQIYSAATDRETAKIVFKTVKNQILGNPSLNEILKVTDSYIENKETKTIYKYISADASKNQGFSPSIVIFDELHAVGGINGRSLRGDEMWAAVTEGSADREESIVIAITTAGANKDGLLGRLFGYGLKISNKEVEDDTFGMAWWQADELDDPTDPKTWFKANPNLAEGIMNIDTFHSSVAQANATNFSSFQRYRLNMWVRTAGQYFINPIHWDKISRDKDIEEGEEIYLGFDGSVTDDATGLVAINKEGTLKVIALWEPNPNDPDYIIDRDEVVETIRETFHRYKVRKLWADPAYFEEPLKQLEKEFPRLVERIPQSNSRVIPMAKTFIADVIAGEIGHTNDVRLTRHVMNAVEKEGGSYKKEKPKSPNKIDLLAASVLANGARHHEQDIDTSPQRIQIL